MRTNMWTYSGRMLLLLLSVVPALLSAAKLKDIKHIIVIYEENRSFDHLFGEFPGANGLAQADATSRVQVDLSGTALPNLPYVPGGVASDSLFPPAVANAPWNIATYAAPGIVTRDVEHKFYQSQKQIDGGRMDRFGLWTDCPALAMGHYPTASIPLFSLASEFTLCDNFFQAAFGGSCVNHLFLIAARSTDPAPVFSTVNQVSVVTDDPATLMDKVVAPGSLILVNNCDPFNPPHEAQPSLGAYVPVQSFATIGDRLSDRHVSWKWYAENWNTVIADPTGSVAQGFDNDHQPFDYFANYQPGTPGRAAHLRDVTEYFSDIQNHRLPAVSWIKPYGNHDDHPGDGNINDSENYVLSLVQALRNSPYWEDSLVVVTYDEYGGWWDHVSPPRIGDGVTPQGRADAFGPGPRIPAILAGRFARRAYVSHVQFDTTSLLKLMESRWRLAPLASRDAAANNLSKALDLDDGEDPVVDERDLDEDHEDAEGNQAGQPGAGAPVAPTMRPSATEIPTAVPSATPLPRASQPHVALPTATAVTHSAGAPGKK
jgi:phospholipase C